ncbi:hypothetical protein LG943_16390 [Streptomonospora sp. S1-112]|uniref:Uncharacterized protein n=1 Tax=Streptomonospora mangrovi TaxID=2883123 RepID=A0A9X3NLD7_9ACTN|nr:hypothetical protein [Streptomonospora mangrovi]MDA0565879.1 hypothetical protein [Streptomonospora mangrovi]
MASDEHRIVARYTERDEEVRAAFSAYTGGGFGRRVVGVTDHRLILVKSGYWSITDKGLLWADPLDRVALKGGYEVWLTSGVNTGNAYVTVRRADGSTLRLNPRSGFVGRTDSAAANIAKLYSLVPGRF